MLASVFIYVGLLLFVLGGICFAKPLRFLGVGNRKRAAIMLGVGIVVAGVGFALPAKEVRLEAARTRLDEFVPVYQFDEIHSIRVHAPRQKVYQAIKSVTADEIFLFRTLTWIRRFGRSGPESILNAPEKMPLLDVATQTTFLLLAEERGTEIVIGTVVLAPSGFRRAEFPTPEDLKKLQAPGFAVAAMNFLVEEAGPDACVVTTETRVYATDASARGKFSRYWRVIYPGSSLIRYSWLRAVRRRAESVGD